MKKLAILTILTLFLGGCTNVQNITIPEDDKSLSGAILTDDLELETTDMTNINQVSQIAIQALKNKDMTTLSQISSKEGIRFSPYSYVDKDKNIVIKKDEIGNIMDSKTQYVWGYQDGTGDPILMNFSQYMDKFVYDVDFVKLGERHINEDIMRGNTINNSSEVYSGKYKIEYYVPGQNTQYENLDRKSLMLIFSQEENNERKLQGIIHNQWTI